MSSTNCSLLRASESVRDVYYRRAVSPLIKPYVWGRTLKSDYLPVKVAEPHSCLADQTTCNQYFHKLSGVVNFGLFLLSFVIFFHVFGDP